MSAMQFDVNPDDNWSPDNIELDHCLISSSILNSSNPTEQTDVPRNNQNGLDNEDDFDVISEGSSSSTDNNCYQEFADRLDHLAAAGRHTSDNHMAKERVVKFQDRMDLREAQNRMRIRDKADRATVSRALDERSMRILYKLLAQGFLHQIDGVISSGKESNVYYAKAGPLAKESVQCTPSVDHLAIKVYMTSIQQFRNRDAYVSGDWRLRSGYCRGSSWKKIRVWAEKEFRNLLRIRQSHRPIPCPRPIKLKGVVLVMDLIGSDCGQAAPRLKDAAIAGLITDFEGLYRTLILQIRELYQECRLVHADLSEYNLLYHNGLIYVIDVSQAVEYTHPKALDFLRSDCSNINNFFQSYQEHTLSLRALFNFIVDPNIPRARDDLRAEEAALDDLIQARKQDSNFDSQEDDNFFKNVFLPRTLNEVINFSRDKSLFSQGEQIDYSSVLGWTNQNCRQCSDKQQTTAGDDLAVNPDSSIDEKSAETSSQSNSSDQDPKDDVTEPQISDRKALKKITKLQQREKRANKISKYDKRKKHSVPNSHAFSGRKK